jgi:tetratricopeptide (TPR) repeat protein
VREAQIRSKNHGLYHSAVELGLFGRGLVDRDAEPRLWWDFTGDITTSMSSSGRAEETEALYREIRAISTDPLIHMYSAYGTAMLYARHYDDARRDPAEARRWVNLAIAIASQLPDPKERAFHSVFNNNGLALVEMRDGHAAEAMRLLDEGMARLDRDLEPGEQLLHRTGLRYNRAQLYVMTGRLPEALDDLDAVIEVDANFHDHYFNRGTVLRRLGRCEEAIADYDRALSLSPPFPEAFYNRADARLELGDVDRARADLDRVLELEPDHVDALLNRAGLLCDLGDVDAAWTDVTAGLGLRPRDPHLLCLRGRLLLDRGDPAAARADLDAALELDGNLAEAWAIRGVLAHGAGDLSGAVADLTRAVELGDSPQIRFNRAVMLEEDGRLAEAVADYEAVLAAEDDPDARTRLDACRLALAEWDASGRAVPANA